MQRSFTQRAVFAFSRAADTDGLWVDDLAASDPAAQARAWKVYATGYATHAQALKGRLALLRQEMTRLEAELADAQAQERAARIVADHLQAPWLERRRTQAKAAAEAAAMAQSAA